MKDFMGALDSIGKKVGIGAMILVAYMYFDIQEMKKDIEKLDRTTADLAEVKENVASINAKLEIILSDFSSSKYTLRSVDNH